MTCAPQILPLRPLALMMLLALAACATTPPIAPAPPVPRPEMPPDDDAAEQAQLRKARAERNRAANAAAADAVSRASVTTIAQQEFYAQAEAQLLAHAKLRRDRVPQDAPIDAEMLTRNFLAIALRDEYARDGGQMVQGGGAAPLRRWQEPVRMQLEFGTATDVATRRSVRVEVADFANRLSAASGHPVGLTDSGGNFVVLVLNDDERRAIGPRLQELVPGIPAQDVALIRDLVPDNFCTVFAYSQGASPVYSRAVALIRTELPPLLRSSCFHEELAQGMGLANDSPEARPSIFNDDEEFGLLTRHDELLLKILYDRRLRPGMTEAEAAPIVRQIAGELLGEQT
ncbi:DUF2927 domain-containing protein [Paracoccus caeni]|nr:DUF2927 domain-containing protein [Paracoccus caeni]